MAVKQLERVFRYNNEDLIDINPTYAPETVMNYYADTYPELINAKIEGPQIEGIKAIYTFTKTIGTKG